ncbi:MAG: hypothetical protein CVU90_08605 [Firmicutes bacterium HGW-Firmicutes-15]|nr:MAG: hypothetical protein CVU90_08605 [Firmicutes bacterium HGW-Firmicutes-15]
MKRFKKLVMAFTVIAVLGAGSAAYAATAMTPAEIAAGLTGKSVETLYQERAAGKTYGTIANEAGKIEEFKSQMLEQKKIVLDQRVADGNLTQEQADTRYNSIKDNQANCDGTGNAKMGKNSGLGLGQGNGMGNGRGAGGGAGICNGTGAGLGQGRNK